MKKGGFYSIYSNDNKIHLNKIIHHTLLIIILILLNKNNSELFLI